MAKKTNNSKIIIYKWHDRHTDDHIEAYEYTTENWDKLVQKCKKDWCMNSGYASNAEGQEMTWGGEDWGWGWSEDYYSALTVLDLNKKVEA